jgi:hypothetical protein
MLLEVGPLGKLLRAYAAVQFLRLLQTCHHGFDDVGSVWRSLE